jgi:hypothetical protein
MLGSVDEAEDSGKAEVRVMHTRLAPGEINLVRTAAGGQDLHDPLPTALSVDRRPHGAGGL